MKTGLSRVLFLSRSADLRLRQRKKRRLRIHVISCLYPSYLANNKKRSSFSSFVAQTLVAVFAMIRAIILLISKRETGHLWSDVQLRTHICSSSVAKISRHSAVFSRPRWKLPLVDLMAGLTIPKFEIEICSPMEMGCSCGGGPRHIMLYTRDRGVLATDYWYRPEVGTFAP